MALVLADRHDLRAVAEPGDRPPDARPGLDRLARTSVERRNDQVDLAIVNGDVAEPLAVRRGQRGQPEGRVRLAVLPGALREHHPRDEVGSDADHLEPAVGIREQEQRAVGQPAWTALRGFAGVDPGLGARGNRQDGDRRAPGIRLALADDRQPAAVRRPGVLVDIDARGRDRDRLGCLRIAGRPPAMRDRRIDQPDLRPAPASGGEGKTPAVRAPARLAVPGRVLGDPDLARSVRLDHPDRAIADEGQTAPVGRPLRVTDRLLGCAQLNGRAAAQRHQEELPGAAGLTGERHEAIPGVDPVLAPGIDRQDALDRQPISGPGAGGRRSLVRRHRSGHSPVAPTAFGQPARAHHGAIMARCDRT